MVAGDTWLLGGKGFYCPQQSRHCALQGPHWSPLSLAPTRQLRETWVDVMHVMAESHWGTLSWGDPNLAWALILKGNIIFILLDDKQMRPLLQRLTVSPKAIHCRTTIAKTVNRTASASFTTGTEISKSHKESSPNNHTQLWVNSLLWLSNHLSELHTGFYPTFHKGLKKELFCSPKYYKDLEKLPGIEYTFNRHLLSQ